MIKAYILNLKLDISSNNGGNDVIEAQRTLEDAKKAYERIAAKYARIYQYIFFIIFFIFIVKWNPGIIKSTP
ncbi:hypothetical protein NE556_24230, partial [[Clostridium] symbiosum]|uniref:hypothetical protein n=1 Tax=Clostridium symbiosum TaxID=1512 RepID=UPI00210F1F12